MCKYAGPYRLKSIVSKMNSSCTETYRSLYSNLEGCIVRNISKYGIPGWDFLTAKAEIVQGRDGSWNHGMFEINGLKEFREYEDGGLEIETCNSVICFDPASEDDLIKQDTGGMIDLYLCDRNAQFAGGIYRDKDQKLHFLNGVVSLGFGQERVMVEPKGLPDITLCSYVPMGDRIEFRGGWGKIQKALASRMRIHNQGKIPLKIFFDTQPETWTIQPGEVRQLTQEGCDDVENTGP